jgi:hypothetical protein
VVASIPLQLLAQLVWGSKPLGGRLLAHDVSEAPAVTISMPSGHLLGAGVAPRSTGGRRAARLVTHLLPWTSVRKVAGNESSFRSARSRA